MSQRRFDIRVLKVIFVVALGVWACGSPDRVFVDITPEPDASRPDVNADVDPASDTGAGGAAPDGAIDMGPDRLPDLNIDARVDGPPPSDARPEIATDTIVNDGIVSNDGFADVTPSDNGADASCPVGSYRCTGANLEHCMGSGWVLRATCATPALCDPVIGMCVAPTCLPGMHRCDGANLQICNSDQNGWANKEMCASAGLCDAVRGMCSTSACMPGAYQCSGATLQQCRTDQTGWDTVMVCASAALCNATTGMCDTPPETRIDSYPANPSNVTSPSFTFSSSKPMGGTFQCRLDGAAFAACTSPHAIMVGGGPHSFEVYAVDSGGVADATPASYAWTVDITAPAVTILSYPANPTRSIDASFSFSSAEAGTTECRLDGGVWGVCSSSTTMQYVNLAPNTSHRFDVRVTDAAGNAGGASYTWTIDTTPPTTTISSGPTGTIYIQTASVAFNANETSTFECSLDGAAFASCTSPRSLSGLLVGSHTLSVRATDAAGNVENPAAARSFTVAYPFTCTRASVGFTSSTGVTSGAAWRVCRSDFTAWVSAGSGGGNYNAVTACRSIGYRSVTTWGGQGNQVCVNESYNGPPAGGTDPTSLGITVHWRCDDCGSPPAVGLTGSAGVVSGASWRVCRADWDSAWVSAQSGGGNYNAVQACQFLGYRTADTWGGNSNNVCLTESYIGPPSGGTDPTSLSITVHWRCVY
jgi:hypothetical protein